VRSALVAARPVALAELRLLVAAERGIALSAAPSVPTSSQPGRGPGVPTADDPEHARMAALVTLAQQGDAEAFGQIYDAYVDTIYRYLYYRVGSHAVAEDLTSETFLRALRRIDSFSWQGKDIGAWFVTIARNLVADHVKSSRFRLEVSTADMLDADRADGGIEDEVLSRIQNAALSSRSRRSARKAALGRAARAPTGASSRARVAMAASSWSSPAAPRAGPASTRTANRSATLLGPGSRCRRSSTTPDIRPAFLVIPRHPSVAADGRRRHRDNEGRAGGLRPRSRT